MKRFRETSPKRLSPANIKSFWGTFREALLISFRHRFLWVLGLFGGASGGSGWTFPAPGDPDQKPEEILRGLIDRIGEKNFELLLIFGLIFAALFLVFALISHAGLVVSFDGLTRAEKWNFKKAFLSGVPYFWRILGQAIVVALIVGFSMSILIGPAASAWTDGTAALKITGSIGIAAGLLVGVLAALLYPFAVRFLVLGKQGIWSSLKSAVKLFREKFLTLIKSWVSALLFNILLIALGAGAILGAIAVSLLIFSALSAIGLPGIWAGIIVFSPLIVAGLLFAGIVAATNSGYWTIIFRKFTS